VAFIARYLSRHVLYGRHAFARGGEVGGMNAREAHEFIALRVAGIALSKESNVRVAQTFCVYGGKARP
jgi:hypothetical protein